MSAIKVLVGQVFERLTVRFDTGKRSTNREVVWSCDCACGREGVPVTGYNLRSGETTSCGCRRSEVNASVVSRNGVFVSREKASVRVTENRVCSTCQETFSITYQEVDEMKFAGKLKNKKTCDKCLVKKSLGTKPSKDDW